MSDPESIRRLHTYVQDKNIATVKLGGADLDGVYRGKRMPVSDFLAGVAGGFAQCDVIFGWDIAEELVPDLAFTGWETGYPDIIARPDLDTFMRVPWENRVATVVCDYTDAHGAPVEITPRRVLQRVQERIAQLGYRAETAVELEFRIFREDQQSLRHKGWRELTPLSPTNSCYSIHRASGDDFILGKLEQLMNEYGIHVEGYNREHGPGMYEMNLKHAPALTAADNTMLFRTGAKEICMQEGLTACFMAKWHDKEDGSSGHLHQSLWNAAGENIFYDPEAPHHISTTMRHYAAGVLATMREFAALYAPNINSYKRYVVGTWAPTTMTWGIETRTTALRMVPHGPRGTRIENRLPGADVNPYLGLAATMAGGLHGLQQKIELPPPARGNAYALSADEAPPLPRSLAEAIEIFAQSSLAREMFGAAFVDHFVAMRRWEVDQYNRVVGDWERERYLEMI